MFIALAAHAGQHHRFNAHNWIFFSFKNLTLVFKVITVYYSQFYFKIKQTSSFTVRQNKEAGEHEHKNCGSFHLRRESPSSDIR